MSISVIGPGLGEGDLLVIFLDRGDILSCSGGDVRGEPREDAVKKGPGSRKKKRVVGVK